MDSLPSFILAALALTGSPGPNTLSLAAVGAAFGRVRGLRYMLGLNLGVAGVIAIVGSGIGGLLFAAPAAAPVITIVAALYFAWLAWRIATAPPLQTDTGAAHAPGWYEGLALSLVNPKAYAAMAAMFSGFTLLTGDPLADTLVKAGVLMITVLFVNACWLSVGSALTPLLKTAHTARIVNTTFAVLLVASVAATAFL